MKFNKNKILGFVLVSPTLLILLGVVCYAVYYVACTFPSVFFAFLLSYAGYRGLLILEKEYFGDRKE